MPQHQTDAYKDGYVWVIYCKICGDENPNGNCVGQYVPHGERKVSKESASKESVDNRVDFKLKCE